MVYIRYLIKITLLIILIISCSGWGFLGHRTVEQLAVYQLRGGLQKFFFSNLNYLVEESIRPDTRRNQDSTEVPKHYIDLEFFGDSAAWKMPYQWEEAINKYSRDTMNKYGILPYQVIMSKDRLTQAFRNKMKDSILLYASDLGHYIADAHVPLHTSINYDGQLTNQKGLHNLWESMIPELELDKYQLYNGHKAVYLSNPEEAIWQAIGHAHNLLEQLFMQEKEVSRVFSDSTKYRVQLRNGKETKTYSSGFARAYSARLGKTINTQLVSSSNLIADFWYTAWVDAGNPDLENLTGSFGKTERKNLRIQKRAYRKGNLLKEKLLVALNRQQ